jgi:hypothetical protein
MKDIINKLNENSIGGQFSEAEAGIGLPIYWSEDIRGNINYDIDSIREAFEALISELEDYNENSDFDWDEISLYVDPSDEN